MHEKSLSDSAPCADRIFWTTDVASPKAALRDFSPHHRFLLPHSSSSSRFTAGASAFFILSQSGER